VRSCTRCEPGEVQRGEQQNAKQAANCERQLRQPGPNLVDRLLGGPHANVPRNTRQDQFFVLNPVVLPILLICVRSEQLKAALSDGYCVPERMVTCQHASERDGRVDGRDDEAGGNTVLERGGDDARRNTSVRQHDGGRQHWFMPRTGGSYGVPQHLVALERRQLDVRRTGGTRAPPFDVRGVDPLQRQVAGLAADNQPRDDVVRIIAAPVFSRED
jgi:hypothetical protein